MILTALNDYYARLSKANNNEIPSLGYASAPISYALVLNKSGELVDVEDLRDTSTKKPKARYLMSHTRVLGGYLV